MYENREARRLSSVRFWPFYPETNHDIVLLPEEGAPTAPGRKEGTKKSVVKLLPQSCASFVTISASPCVPDSAQAPRTSLFLWFFISEGTLCHMKLEKISL